ncbi:MAG: porin family protein [Burkholderiaceae bacterium]
MKKQFHSLTRLMLLPVAFAAPSLVIAAESTTGLYLKPIFGLSQMSNQSALVEGSGLSNGPASIGLGSGFNAGLLFGYRMNSSWSIELGWEYRSNEADITLANGDRFSDGNYASNQFFINGLYHFAGNGRWDPYVGAGLLWGQEIDIDLEQDGIEQSFDGQGDIGVQVLAGLNYRLSEAWTIGGEFRYGKTSGIDLGPIRGLNYSPTTLQLTMSYRF